MSDPPRASKADDIVVFEIVRDSVCSECGDQLGRGSWLRLERERPLCMSCADLGHLVFLPSGDAALTRRAGRYSPLKAVVVRFSRARGRYERQGLLVEESALARAELSGILLAYLGLRSATVGHARPMIPLRPGTRGEEM